MKQLKPLNGQVSKDPVLFIDPQAARIDLADNASHRLSAVKDLMGALACMKIDNGADGNSITAIASASYLLLADAQDLLSAATANAGGKAND